ncbi:hypothetical protein COOONC_01229 [Cooperia oncophora]
MFKLLEDPVFTQLRTVEQLGYTAEIVKRQNAGTNALQLRVQGTHSPDHVHGRIEAFLEKMEVSFVTTNGCYCRTLEVAHMEDRIGTLR